MNLSLSVYRNLKRCLKSYHHQLLNLKQNHLLRNLMTKSVSLTRVNLLLLRVQTLVVTPPWPNQIQSSASSRLRLMRMNFRTWPPKIKIRGLESFLSKLSKSMLCKGIKAFQMMGKPMATLITLITLTYKKPTIAHNTILLGIMQFPTIMEKGTRWSTVQKQ